MLAISFLRRRIAHSDEEHRWGELIRRSTSLRVARKAPVLFVGMLAPFLLELGAHVAPEVVAAVDSLTAATAKEMRKNLSGLEAALYDAQREATIAFKDRWKAVRDRAATLFPTVKALQAVVGTGDMSLGHVRRMVRMLNQVADREGLAHPARVEFGSDPKWRFLREVVWPLQCEFELAEPVAFASMVLLATPSMLRSKSEMGPSPPLELERCYLPLPLLPDGLPRG